MDGCPYESGGKQNEEKKSCIVCVVNSNNGSWRGWLWIIGCSIR